jgi:hypothetical protein
MSSRYPRHHALLGNRFAPITHAFGFLEAQFTAVVDADREWRRTIGDYPSRPQIGDLADALSALLPLTAPLSRYILVGTNGSWTAYFDNFRNGGDPWSPIPHLARMLGCRAVAIFWAPQTRTAYGGSRFDLYGQRPADALNYTRSVSAINDGGRWDWSAIGHVQPFEETDAYSAKRVRDRLTPEMLDRYCRALGIRPFDSEYYGRHGLLVTNGDLHVKLLEESLAEAHARMDIQVGT